jgi:hypothetical protein
MNMIAFGFFALRPYIMQAACQLCVLNEKSLESLEFTDSFHASKTAVNTVISFLIHFDTKKCPFDTVFSVS